MEKIQNGGRSPSYKMSNDLISATGHAIHFAFGSMVGFRVGGSNVSTSGWTKSKIADVSRLVSLIILNGHISETVHPIRFVYLVLG